VLVYASLYASLTMLVPCLTGVGGMVPILGLINVNSSTNGADTAESNNARFISINKTEKRLVINLNALRLRRILRYIRRKGFLDKILIFLVVNFIMKHVVSSDLPEIWSRIAFVWRILVNIAIAMHMLWLHLVGTKNSDNNYKYSRKSFENILEISLLILELAMALLGIVLIGFSIANAIIGAGIDLFTLKGACGNILVLSCLGIVQSDASHTRSDRILRIFRRAKIKQIDKAGQWPWIKRVYDDIGKDWVGQAVAPVVVERIIGAGMFTAGAMLLLSWKFGLPFAFGPPVIMILLGYELIWNILPGPKLAFKGDRLTASKYTASLLLATLTIEFLFGLPLFILLSLILISTLLPHFIIDLQQAGGARGERQSSHVVRIREILSKKLSPTKPSPKLQLEDGAKIVIAGGGPAGSFSAINILREAEQEGLKIKVIIIERKKEVNLFERANSGMYREVCNYCAGGISPRMNDVLEDMKLSLPKEVIEGEVKSIVMHGHWKNIVVKVPPERNMVSVYRGSRPKGRPFRYFNFDSFLLDKAISEGAEVITGEVSDIEYSNIGKPLVHYKVGKDREEIIEADFMVFAGGVNQIPGMKLEEASIVKSLQKLIPGFTPPRITKTLIFELDVGEEFLRSMEDEIYVILYGAKDLKLEMISLVPKGRFLTVV